MALLRGIYDNNYITGTSYNDTIIGSTGNDTLSGGSGNDSMIGGTGNDIYYINTLNDKVIENTGGGIDTVISSITYTLGSNVENLALTGYYNINATGNELDNWLKGNGAANIINALEGADTMEGGGGNDIYYVDSSGDVVIENLYQGTDTIYSTISYTLPNNIESLILIGTEPLIGVGNTASNTIKGNKGDNKIDSFGGNDIIYGFEGNDTLIGGNGTDRLYGGTGDDVFYIDRSGDMISENAGEGNDTAYSPVSYILGYNVENLILTGTSSVSGSGNILNNIITGNSGNNILDGKSGKDTMVGGAGNDVYYIDNAGDVIIENANEGVDTVYASISCTIGANIEIISLTGYAVSVTGNEQNNTIKGNYYNNVIDGGSGADTMIGGYGNDIYYVDNEKDSIIELAYQGTDTVYASISYKLGDQLEYLALIGAGDITATGNNLNNYITGNARNNVLTGNAGIDTLIGNAGDDTLDGGSGYDKLYGGTGNDYYIVDSPYDVIYENAGEGTDTVCASFSCTLGANLENLALQGSSGELITISYYKQAILYGDSLAWKTYLDFYQGDNTLGFRGDCGIVACENILIQAGVFDKKVGYAPSVTKYDALESYIVNYAVANSFCYTSGTVNEKGATTTNLQSQILDSLGVEAHSELATLDKLAAYIKDGYCVAAAVNGQKIWGTYSSTSGVNHTITITGAAYSSTNPNVIEGFYICDSARGLAGDAARFISYYQMQQAFCYYTDGISSVRNLGFLVVTDDPVRQSLGMVNGTGNELDNTITGTSGTNILCGKDGNDYLDGKDGRDILLGGTGNDTLIGGSGNDTYQFYLGDGKDMISDESGSDSITFGSGITKNNIALFMDNSNLIVDYGSNNSVAVLNYSENSIENIKLNDGSFLANIDVNRLLQDIAAYSSSNGISIVGINDVKANQDLMNIIINSWQA